MKGIVKRDNIQKHSPCLGDVSDLVDEVFADKQDMTVEEFIQHSHLPMEWRMWVILQADVFTSDQVIRVKDSIRMLVGDHPLKRLLETRRLCDSIGVVMRVFGLSAESASCLIWEVVRNAK